ncbi:hypothetical protein B0H10DRAFT_803130 [Mycena sp. CBHHK59/15]|nr:hypothetical protein B0H10DRAFT_803130 [Mycena sp. CBHHK59/15]
MGEESPVAKHYHHSMHVETPMWFLSCQRKSLSKIILQSSRGLFARLVQNMLPSSPHYRPLHTSCSHLCPSSFSAGNRPCPPHCREHRE